MTSLCIHLFLATQPCPGTSCPSGWGHPQSGRSVPPCRFYRVLCRWPVQPPDGSGQGGGQIDVSRLLPITVVRVITGLDHVARLQVGLRPMVELLRTQVVGSCNLLVPQRNSAWRAGKRGGSVSPGAHLIYQTTLPLHLPRLKNIALTTASDENAIVTAQKTPCGPKPSVMART